MGGRAILLSPLTLWMNPFSSEFLKKVKLFLTGTILRFNHNVGKSIISICINIIKCIQTRKCFCINHLWDDLINEHKQFGWQNFDVKCNIDAVWFTLKRLSSLWSICGFIKTIHRDTSVSMKTNEQILHVQWRYK